MLKDKEVFLGEAMKYTLPVILDPDTSQIPRIVTVTMKNEPSFYSYDTELNQITFNPTHNSSVGNHTVYVMITDGIESPEYQFIIRVGLIPSIPNVALEPRMSGKIARIVQVQMNSLI